MKREDSTYSFLSLVHFSSAILPSQKKHDDVSM